MNRKEVPAFIRSAIVYSPINLFIPFAFVLALITGTPITSTINGKVVVSSSLRELLAQAMDESAVTMFVVTLFIAAFILGAIQAREIVRMLYDRSANAYIQSVLSGRRGLVFQSFFSFHLTRVFLLKSPRMRALLGVSFVVSVVLAIAGMLNVLPAEGLAFVLPAAWVIASQAIAPFYLLLFWYIWLPKGSAK